MNNIVATKGESLFGDTRQPAAGSNNQAVNGGNTDDDWDDWLKKAEYELKREKELDKKVATAEFKGFGGGIHDEEFDAWPSQSNAADQPHVPDPVTKPIENKIDATHAHSEPKKSDWDTDEAWEEF